MVQFIEDKHDFDDESEGWDDSSASSPIGGNRVATRSPPPSRVVRLKRRNKIQNTQERDRTATPEGRMTKVGVFLVALLLSWIFFYKSLQIGTELAPSTDCHHVTHDDNFYSQQAEQIISLRKQLAAAEATIREMEGKDISLIKKSFIEKALPTVTAQPSFQKSASNPLPSERLLYSLDSIMERAVNDTVILTFCSIKYSQPMVNWISFLHQHKISNYGIVCLDLQLRHWLQERGSECQYILSGWEHGVWDPPEIGTECSDVQGITQPTDGPMKLAKCLQSCEYDTNCAAINFNPSSQLCQKCKAGFVKTLPTGSQWSHQLKRTRTTLWFARWKLLTRLLNSGIHVILSDLDAIFVRNPMQFISQIPPADLLAQRGSFPQWLSERWGAALCMGFVCWRSTEATRKFTVEMHRVISNTGDDQIAVNVALDDVGIKWDEGVVQFNTSTSVSYGTTTGDLRVALLPHSKFPRRCEPGEFNHSEITVAHCYESKKEGTAKMNKAKAFGLWNIVDDWEKIPIPASKNFREYIASISLVT